MTWRYPLYVLGLVIASTSGLAQSNSPPSSSPTRSSPHAALVAFIAEQGPGEWRGAKLVGTEIYNENSERIGEVNDMLVADSGHVVAVVIGVGGFLGLGEKNIAVPFQSIEWVSRSMTEGMHKGNTGGTAAESRAREADLFRQRGGDPQHGVLRITKADLRAAPPFSYAGSAGRR